MNIDFSFTWFFVLFLLQMMSLGITLTRLGEVKKISKHSVVELFWGSVFCFMSWLAIYLWK